MHEQSHLTLIIICSASELALLNELIHQLLTQTGGVFELLLSNTAA